MRSRDRPGPPGRLDDLLLDRLAIAAATVVERYGPARTTMTDPALVELVISSDSDEAARAVVLTGWQFQRQPELAATTMLLFVLVYVLAAVGEELGWSGYVVEPLQRRFGALGGNLVLAVVWWGFHVPSIVQSGQGPTLIVLGFFGALAFRVLWGWLFNNTGGSVFAIVVVHALTNLCTAYVPGIPTSANAPVLVAFAVLVTLLWGPRTLSRFRLPAHASR